MHKTTMRDNIAAENEKTRKVNMTRRIQYKNAFFNSMTPFSSKIDESSLVRHPNFHQNATIVQRTGPTT